MEKLVFSFKFDDEEDLNLVWSYVRDCFGGPDSGGSDSKRRQLQYLNNLFIEG